MHRPIKEHLESYLRNDRSPEIPSEFQAHLSGCASCRREVGQMRTQALLLQVLRPERDGEPAAGFYARVMDRVEAQRPPSAWNALLEPILMRRLVVACLVVVVVLASYIVGTEPGEPIAASSPELIMATEPRLPLAGLNPDHDRAAVLLSLATYRE